MQMQRIAAKKLDPIDVTRYLVNLLEDPRQWLSGSPT